MNDIGQPTPRDVPGKGLGRHRAGWLLVGACAVTLLTFFLPGVNAAVCRNFPDDALFYNLIARNLLAGRGSTCDGLAQSNGYHPLWMLVLVPIEALPGHSPAPELILLFLINAAAAWLLYLWLVPLSNRPAALAVALLATFEQSLFPVTWSGMETALAWLLLIGVLHLLRAGPLEEWTPRRRWTLRLGLLLLLFARLDGGLCWVAVCVASLLRLPLKPHALADRAMGLLRFFLPPTLVAAAYFAFNHWWFGTAMPISGRIKSIPLGRLFAGDYDWSQAWFRFRGILSPDPLHRFLGLLANKPSLPSGVAEPAMFFVFLAFLLAAIAWMLIRFRGDFALRCLALDVLLHAAYYTLLQSGTFALNWAKGPELLLTYTAAACALHGWAGVGRPTRWGRLAAWTCLALVIASGTYCHARRMVFVDRIHDFGVARRDFFDAVRFIDRQVPPGEPIMTWNVGFLGYYTGRPVVSHDGLLNSLTYYRRYQQTGRVADYMRENKIHWIANQLPKEGDPAQLLAGQFAGLRPQDVEILAVFEKGVNLPDVKNRYAVARCRW